MKIVYAPRVNPNDEFVTIVKYLRKNGAQVTTNDLVLEIETSKVAQELEAPIDGYIEYTCVEGSEINVGEELFRIHRDPFEADIVRQNENSQNTNERKISKKAASLLEENNIDPRNIPGTGIINLQKVEKYITEIKSEDFRISSNRLSPSQKIVAQNLKQSIETNVHARLTARIKFDDELIPTGASLLDIIAISVAKALEKFNSFNAHLVGEKIIQNENINIGFTLDHDGKLLVLSVPFSTNFSVEAFSEKRIELMMSLLRGGGLVEDVNPTFVISVIESRHIDMHYPIIFPGNSGILAVAVKNTNCRLKDIGLCLAYDHRCINGNLASKFLDQIISNLELS